MSYIVKSIQYTSCFYFLKLISLFFVLWRYSRNGDTVPFVTRGRCGVFKGSISETFAPYHILISTNTPDDMDEEAVMQKVSLLNVCSLVFFPYTYILIYYSFKSCADYNSLGVFQNVVLCSSLLLIHS